MKNIIIIGASGHGSVILDCLEQEGKYKVIGFVDSFKKRVKSHNGYPILGSEKDLPALSKKHNIFGGIIAIGDNWTRKSLVEKITRLLPDFNFISAIHPKAIIGKDVFVGRGTAIMPGCIVNASSVVGDFCILNTNSSLGHEGTLEDFSSLASGVCTGGNFYLGKYSAVSLGTNVIENISIMEHTVIGAGSLVLKDVKSHVLAYGSPAKVIRTRMPGDRYLTGTKIRKVVPFVANNF